MLSFQKLQRLGGEESENIDAIPSGQIDFSVESTASLFRTRREYDVGTNTWSWSQANLGSDSVSAACQSCDLGNLLTLSELQTSHL